MRSFPQIRVFLAAAAMVAVASAALAPALHAASPDESQHGGAAVMDHAGTASTMDHGMPCHDPMQGMKHDDMMSCMMQQRAQAMGHMPGGPMHGSAPALPGQDAFGAIQEIVRGLEADPQTDWSKVDLEALRQHLIDMSDVTLQANIASKPVDGGLQMIVTGSGRTLAAIRRMVPMHATEINGLNGWNATAEVVGDGVRLTVTSSDPREVQHLRGLGFIGILVTGSHHQMHHLAMAKGQFSPAH